MSPDLDELKATIALLWKEFASNLSEVSRRVGVRSAYGFLIAAAFLPLLQAYSTDPTPIILALMTVASGVGSNLLSNFIQKVFDKNLTPAELEKLAKKDPDIQAVVDALLSKTESIQAAQQALGNNWEAFSTQLKSELRDLRNSPQIIATMNGKTVIKDITMDAPINITVERGGQLIIHSNYLKLKAPSQRGYFPGSVSFGEE